MAKRGVIESINMKSTSGAARIYDAVFDEDLDNGTIGHLDGLDVDGSTIYKFKKGYSSAHGKTLVIVDDPAWSYDDGKRTNQRRDKFYIPAGKIFRVRTLEIGDEFGINDALIGMGALGGAELTTGFTLQVPTNDGKYHIVLTEAGLVSGVPTFQILRKRIVGNTLVTSERRYGHSNTIYELKLVAKEYQ